MKQSRHANIYTMSAVLLFLGWFNQPAQLGSRQWPNAKLELVYHIHWYNPPHPAVPASTFTHHSSQAFHFSRQANPPRLDSPAVHCNHHSSQTLLTVTHSSKSWATEPSLVSRNCCPAHLTLYRTPNTCCVSFLYLPGFFVLDFVSWRRKRKITPTITLKDSSTWGDTSNDIEKNA